MRLAVAIKFHFASEVLNKAIFDSVNRSFSSYPLGFGDLFSGVHQAGDNAHCFSLLFICLLAAAYQRCRSNAVPGVCRLAVVDVLAHGYLRLCFVV